jgi:hypothetical protein
MFSFTPPSLSLSLPPSLSLSLSPPLPLSLSLSLFAYSLSLSPSSLSFHFFTNASFPRRPFFFAGDKIQNKIPFANNTMVATSACDGCLISTELSTPSGVIRTLGVTVVVCRHLFWAAGVGASHVSLTHCGTNCRAGCGQIVGVHRPRSLRMSADRRLQKVAVRPPERFPRWLLMMP